MAVSSGGRDFMESFFWRNLRWGCIHAGKGTSESNRDGRQEVASSIEQSYKGLGLSRKISVSR